VGWRFSSRTRRILAALATAVAVCVGAGCGKNAVRASEKEFLADRVMVFDEDSQESAADEHVTQNREGSAGGRGTSGGGCGCN
jgi:hypothetical protein